MPGVSALQICFSELYQLAISILRTSVPCQHLDSCAAYGAVKLPGKARKLTSCIRKCGSPAAISKEEPVFLEFPKLPRPIRFLITSRREADLTASFALQFVEKSIGTAASGRDVQQFIYHEMERIRLDRKLGPAAWPKPTQMQAMIKLADGLFI
ncbi:hypothetical protein DFH06DRAFT_1340338 [Mycena polygramma]|nr:hypothetical protein DFH06DRAFT_1340338 [Mycena polygramma]